LAQGIFTGSQAGYICCVQAVLLCPEGPGKAAATQNSIGSDEVGSIMLARWLCRGTQLLLSTAKPISCLSLGVLLLVLDDAAAQSYALKPPLSLGMHFQQGDSKQRKVKTAE